MWCKCIHVEIVKSARYLRHPYSGQVPVVLAPGACFHAQSESGVKIRSSLEMFCRPPPSQPIGGVRVLPSHLPPFKTQPWRRFSTHLLPSSTHLPTHLLLFSTHLPTMEQPRPHLPALNFELVNERVGDYFRNEREDVANWQSKSEIPSQEEILGTDKPHSLVPNIPDASWPSSEEYLQAHCNLLREDAVTPLRDAVAMVQDNPLQADEKGVAVYENVSQTDPRGHYRQPSQGWEHLLIMLSPGLSHRSQCNGPRPRNSRLFLSSPCWQKYLLGNIGSPPTGNPGCSQPRGR